MTEKQLLSRLIARYRKQKSIGAISDTSEEDMRGWIDSLLEVFGWDTKDTLQVAKEKTLSSADRKRLESIGSHHKRPDYTLKNNETRLCFVDAKNINEDILNSAQYAFQIRSYGYSINAPISILTNFEQLAVYDCQVKPNISDEARKCRLFACDLNQYIDNYDEIAKYLNRGNLIAGVKLSSRSASPIDKEFANELRIIRLEIGEEIAASCSPKPSFQDLNFLTQTIINRILFIRVCEARGLEKDGLLQDFNTENFWEKFSESSYGRFYDKYDGPLFKGDDKLKPLVIDNSAFSHFLSLLYYPSPYCFDVISLQSISDIYDLFLGYQLCYDNVGNVVDTVKIDVPKTGSVTTPKEVVDKVVSSTLSPSILASFSLDEMQEIKILDPACGSGIFLISAFNEIEEEIIRRNKRLFSKKTPGYCRTNGKKILDISGRKRIISNCLFGVDINKEAVEVAKLSLSLRVIDGYESEDFRNVGLTGSQILNGIGNNIKCGNTLVAGDILERYPEICSKTEELIETNIFNWEEAFPGIIGNKKGFDFVIGNPPYVEVVNYNKRLPTMAKYIKERYPSCQSGKIDLSMPFIDKSLSLLSPTGKLGFIIQKRFFKADYGDVLRNRLACNNLIQAIYDYDNQQVFAGLDTYVCILVCDNQSKRNTFKYTNLASNKVVSIPFSGLIDNVWCLNDFHIFQKAQALKKSLGSFLDICSISDGIQVLWKKAYQISPIEISNGHIIGASGIDSSVDIELGACRPLVRNSEFEPFMVPEYGKYAIFPYEIVANAAHAIQFTEFCTRFPLAGRYLLSHKNEIESNVETVPVKTPSKSATEDWHLYTRRSHLEQNGPKICVPAVALEPQAGIIKDYNVYLDNANIFFLQVDGNDIDRMYAISAIVNSTPFAAFAKCYAQPQTGGYWKFNKQALQDVPFPKEAFLSNQTEISRLCQLGREIEETKLRQGRLGTMGERLQPIIDKDWKEIDDICNHLYGLTDSEIKEVYAKKRCDRNERCY